MTRHNNKPVLWSNYPDLLLPGETRMMIDDLLWDFRCREAFRQSQAKRDRDISDLDSEDIAREALANLSVLTKPPGSA